LFDTQPSRAESQSGIRSHAKGHLFRRYAYFVRSELEPAFQPGAVARQPRIEICLENAVSVFGEWIAGANMIAEQAEKHWIAGYRAKFVLGGAQLSEKKFSLFRLEFGSLNQLLPPLLGKRQDSESRPSQLPRAAKLT